MPSTGMSRSGCLQLSDDRIHGELDEVVEVIVVLSDTIVRLRCLWAWSWVNSYVRKKDGRGEKSAGASREKKIEVYLPSHSAAPTLKVPAYCRCTYTVGTSPPSTSAVAWCSTRCRGLAAVRMPE